jgi:hypothetical protein
MFRPRLEPPPPLHGPAPPGNSAAEGLLHPLWPNGLLARGRR